MRVLICGDRNWTNAKFIVDVLTIIHKSAPVDVVIEGEARGADRFGALAARMIGLPENRILKFPANWTKHGKAAGPIRNRQMLTEGKPDLVLAFHNDIANSKGTKDMVRCAMKAGIETRVFAEGKGEINVRLR